MVTSFSLIQIFETTMHFAILFAQLVYVLIAFIQTRQVKLMNTSFKTPQAPFFSFLAKIHLLAAVIVFFVSLFVLL